MTKKQKPAKNKMQALYVNYLECIKASTLSILPQELHHAS